MLKRRTHAPTTANGIELKEKLTSANLKFEEFLQPILAEICSRTQAYLFSLELYINGIITRDQKQECNGLPNDPTRNSYLLKQVFQAQDIDKTISALEKSHNEYIIEIMLEEFEEPKSGMASSSAPLASSLASSGSPLEQVNQGDSSSKVKNFRLFNTPPKHFVGRMETLYQIHAQLLACSSNSKWSDRTVIIHGPAGIGKTEVARMYAYIFADNPIIQNVAWIDSGNLASLKKSFSSLAKSLGIDIKGKEVERVVEIIYTYFSDHIGTGLFIFDNAKQMRGTHMEIFNFLPTHYLARRPLILINSRSDKWEIKKQQWISIQELNEEDAVTYFCKRLNVTEDQKNYEDMIKSFKKLAGALHRFPLALALTASNIEDKTSSEIDDIAAGFMTNALHSNKNNVNLCIDVVQEALGDAESNSRKLLNILAYLPTDDICVETVEKIFKYIFKNASNTEDFSALEKCSLITIQNHGLDLNGESCQPIEISEQVQKWARKRLHSMGVAPLNYLTQICEYYCHIEDFTYLEVTTACLHSHLRKLNWPGDSVKYSVLFAAKLVSKIELTLAHGSAWEMARDVYNFCTANPIDNLLTVWEDLNKLLHLCQYFLNETSTHDKNLLFNKMGMGMSELEKKWLESVGFYIKNNFPSVTVHDGKCEPRLIETLQSQITQKLIMKKRHHRMVVQKAIRNLLLERSTPDIMKLDATLTYYQLLWKYCWHSECIESLVVKLRTLHFQFYENTYSKLSEAGKIMYWEKGPLLYYKLVNLLLKKSEDSEECKWSSKSKSLFLVSFCAIRNCQILAQHLEYLSELDFIPPEAEFLLQFITCLVMDSNQSCADYLAKTSNFSCFLYEFTHTKLALDNKENKGVAFWSNLVWLALFAKSKTWQNVNPWKTSSQSRYYSKLNQVMSNFSPSVISQLHKLVKINENTVEKAVTELVINVLDLCKEKLETDPKLKLWNRKHASIRDTSPYKPVPEMSIITLNEREVMFRIYLGFACARYKEEMDALTTSSAYSMDAMTLQEYHKSSVNKAIDLISEAVQLTHKEINYVQQLLKQAFNSYQNIYSNIREKTGPPIGIDLGTTYCCMAVVRGVTESPEVIMGHVGLPKIPSYVSFPFCDEDKIKDDDEYKIHHGDYAYILARVNPKGTIFDLNRMIGRKFNDPRIQHDRQFWPFDIIEERGEIKVVTGPNTSQYPCKIMAKLIKWLKQTADDYLGYRVQSAVIALPVYFSQHQRELLSQACEQAGLQILQFVTQLTAAAVHTVANSPPIISKYSTYSKNCLIFDFGGGTLDLAFLEVTEGQVHVKAIGGDNYLGGRDIDNNLVQYCTQQFLIKHGINLAKDRTATNPVESIQILRRLGRIKDECETQKRCLSHAKQIVISLANIYNDLDMSVTVTQELFDEINMGLFERCIEVLRRFLERLNIPKTRIEDVVITGGSCKIPRIQKMLSDFFDGKPLCKNVDPDNAVALGAAFLAYNAQNVRVPNILLQDNVSISPSKYGEPTHVKSMIPFASTEKQNIGIYITANTFQVGMCKESNVQSFTKLIAIPPAVYFADEEILIGAKAQDFSSSAFSYIKERFFNIFELINSAPKAKTHRLNIQDTQFTLCTAHIIAAFFYQVFNTLNISGDAKIIVTLPFGKTYPGINKIRKSLTILGYFNIRILPSLAAISVASLDTLGYYKNVENEAPFRKYIFVLDIQIDSFSMAILEILHKRISVISSRHSESFAACQTERFAQCHADWYKGVKILQEWKDYIQSVYESLIHPFSTISVKAYAQIDAVVINESECSTSLARMVEEVLGGKFKNLKISQIGTSSLLGASLLASPLSGAKSMEDAHILGTNMEVDMTGLISKSLVLTTNIEGQQVIIDNFTRQKFKISTDVTPTSKEKMEPKYLYLLLQNKSNRIDGDIVTSDAGYYQCTVKKNRGKRQLSVSKSIEFEIISKEDLDGFFSLNVVNKSDPDFEILLTKKENLVCNSVCVSPAFSEFGRLIEFYERREAKTIREQFSSETKTDLAKIETKTTINPVLPTMHGDK